jgi:hypothetical protein
MGSREKWLLSILTGVFLIQASVLIYGVRICAQTTREGMPETTVTKVCPQIGERFDLTFGTMIATTLALLTGSSLAQANTTTKRPTTKAKPPYVPPKPGRQ